MQIFHYEKEVFDHIVCSGSRMFYPPAIETMGGVVLDTPETVFGFPSLGFPSLCSTDEYVYGVFINGKNPDDFNNISVFDWEGNEVATYETDCNVLRICCDDNRELRLGELK